MRPYSRAIVGIVFSVSTSLVAMWVMSRFPGMDIPTPYWIFGFFAPLFISTPVCLLLARQVEQKRRLAESLQKAMAELRHLSEIDQMTGLFNRATFLLRLEQARAAAPGVCLLIDVDHFKTINDRWGHATGDQALTAIAGGLRRSVRADDICGRMGGEEFAVYLPEMTGEKGALLADRIRLAVEALSVRNDEGHVVPLTVSIGCAADENAATAEMLLRRADLAMYAAKAAGRNQIRLAA
ncbi:GGDEF domain-containing protein [uncultured Sphingobium sp.]|jgi:diguanylate cyclase (GGDEF)-like protein|uniref:GGDEF domain-containing protein n=3 Tax=Sphingobium TaxID=165695 RepID=UPI000C3C4433|nr:GGDEF domain-containing protein [Sphingobium sp.]MBS48786.1 GGDEF domain-containing protein [Sphingobium sp.]MCC4254860.1 GGDEF domain-containing protein [Sphingobium lactosutens]MEE2741005.1 GGDEF domain-containing protein [Pseudomonadota bacterium]|tara:strand:- start:1793 stop:2509 length:717 start_codon:yes stop_codon:yes gene_type:complete